MNAPQMGSSAKNAVTAYCTPREQPSLAAKAVTCPTPTRRRETAYYVRETRRDCRCPATAQPEQPAVQPGGEHVWWAVISCTPKHLRDLPPRIPVHGARPEHGDPRQPRRADEQRRRAARCLGEPRRKAGLREVLPARRLRPSRAYSPQPRGQNSTAYPAMQNTPTQS